LRQLDLLLCDDTNPRSVAFQLRLIAEHLDNLARRDVRPLSQPEQKIARAALTAVELFDVERVGSTIERDSMAMLDDLLGGTQSRLSDLSEAITRAYFSHVETVQSIGYEIAPVGGEGA
jgi:uncharacterized alpha-E superfamily protein